MNPSDMLIAATARRSDEGALQRRLERADAANQVNGIGPDPERVTTAVMLRNIDPTRPRLNRALALLADDTARELRRK